VGNCAQYAPQVVQTVAGYMQRELSFMKLRQHVEAQGTAAALGRGAESRQALTTATQKRSFLIGFLRRR